MPKQRTIFLITLISVGILTVLVLAISIILFPSSYNTPEKIVLLTITALTGVLTTAKGIKDVFELTRDVLGQPISIPNNVPRPSMFLGRTKEIRDITRLLQSKKIKTILIIGIGGIGKSTLAQETVHRLAKHFFGGMIWISVRDFPDFTAEQFFQQVFQALDLDVGKAKNGLQTHLTKYLNTKRSVIIIDNIETVPVQELRKIRNLIDSILLGSGSKFILTSRVFLPFFAEKIDDYVFYLNDGLDTTNAVRYLVALSTRQEPIHHSLVESAEWVVTRVQGHPKMLEIIASTTRLRGWQRVRVLLEKLDGELAERLRELYASSIQLLGAEGQRVLPYLTVLPTARFSPEEIIAACGDSANLWALRGLEQICDIGLATYNTESDYFTIHQTVYDYICEYHPLKMEERSLAYFRLSEYFGNRGNLGYSVWMWCKATGKDDVTFEDAISMWSETVRNWLITKNAQNRRLTRAST